MNRNLTPAQKNDAVKKIKAADESPLAAPWIPYAGIVVLGLIVLVVAVAARGSRVPVKTPSSIPVAVDQGMDARAPESAAAHMTPAERLAAARGISTTPTALLEFEPEPVADEEPGAPAASPPVLDPLPTTKEQVAAIPLARRGISFFTSRPLSLDDMVEVPIVIGGQIRSVYTTQKESENIKVGNVPQVRSFTVSGRPVPWYRCAGYDPYTNFWEVVGQGWVMLDVECPSTWLTLGDLDPNIEDYTNRLAKPGAVFDTPAAAPDVVPVSVASSEPPSGTESEAQPHLAELQGNVEPIGAESEDEPEDVAIAADGAPPKPRKNTAKIGPAE